MRGCDREELLCTCVDWGKDDLAARIHHIICNFEFTGFELEYTLSLIHISEPTRR